MKLLFLTQINEHESKSFNSQLAIVREEKSKRDAPNKSWILTEDGILKIFTLDFAETFEEKEKREEKWRRKAKKLILCEGITEIKDAYFSKMQNLEEIDFPKSLTKIGKCSFYHCERLRHIKIPYGTKEIMENAFLGCYRLSQIVIPESVKYIGMNAFLYCCARCINVASDCEVLAGNFHVNKSTV